MQLRGQARATGWILPVICLVPLRGWAGSSHRARLAPEGIREGVRSDPGGPDHQQLGPLADWWQGLCYLWDQYLGEQLQGFSEQPGDDDLSWNPRCGHVPLRFCEWQLPHRQIQWRQLNLLAHTSQENALPGIPEGMRGRGLVTTVYSRRLPMVLANIARLRANGCKLPIQVWHDDELPVEECTTLGLWSVECRSLRNLLPRESMRGYQLSLPSIVFSEFEQILFFSSDVFFAGNICDMFDSPEFEEYGYVLWPELWESGMVELGSEEARYYADSTHPEHVFWDLFNVLHNSSNPQHRRATDTQLVLLDKRRHWDVLNLALLFCTDPPEKSRQFYFRGHSYGAMNAEKDSHKWALLALNRPFYLVERGGTVGSLEFVADLPHFSPCGLVIYGPPSYGGQLLAAAIGKEDGLYRGLACFDEARVALTYSAFGEHCVPRTVPHALNAADLDACASKAPAEVAPMVEDLEYLLYHAAESLGTRLSSVFKPRFECS
ncbi:unnamed protein product [Polarella glacialis]|uniref:Protein xylosyltransferase n=1 Tax=Polarella glacialis TaxID=89957 RepID=A0A813GD03_POLGL|nr:unnamed protein product [Polarella glacialis]CAE8725041.1 unnamed protein product [Polarella glacialis]